MRHRVVGLTGHARSGKTSAAEYYKQTYAAKVLTNSVPIAETVARICLPQNRKSYADVAMAIFDVFGMDLVARHWLRIIAKDESDSLYVVEGIRYQEEVSLYKRMTRFFLIGIESDDALRYARSQSAIDSQKDRDQSYDEFRNQKTQRNESSIDAIVAQADATIANNGSLDQFHASLSRLIESFLAR